MKAAVFFTDTEAPDQSADHLVIASDIESSRRTIERSFLDMGQRLMDCHKMLREIAAAYEGMPAELQSEDLTAAVSLLDTLRSEARRIANLQDAEGAQVDGLMTMATGLLAPIERLSQEIRNLGLITTNARIVAAGMAEHRGDFDAFALEMMELGKSASAIVVEFSKSHKKLVDALSPASAANRAFRQQHRNTLAAISAQLDEQIALIEEHKRHAIADVEQSGRLTAQISARIGQAVSALQIGDITRQRLERVEEALRELNDTNASTATEAIVLRIQALQLENASNEFVREVSGFAEALRSLSDDARSVLDDSAANSDALLAKGGKALAGLVDQLRAMILMLSDFAEMRTRLEGLGVEVKDCLHAMQERMHAIAELEHAMRLLSINTAIRCAHFGEEGHALRVVAQQMRQLSSDAVDAARKVMAELATSKDTLPADQGTDECSAGASARALVDDAEMAIEQINAVVGRLREHAGSIAQSGPRAALLVQEAADAAHAHERRADDWQAAIEILHAASADPAPEDSVDEDLLQRLRLRYTMASEREIHDDVCAPILRSAAG